MNFKQLPRKIIEWTFQNSKIVHALTLACMITGLLFAKKLELRTDFSELLPQKLPSVISIKEASSRLGGTGLLIVGVIGPEFKSNKKFVEAFVSRLDKEVASDIRFIEYKFDTAKQFGEKFGLHYLSNEDLQKLKEFLDKKVREKVDHGFASSLGIDDEEQSSKPKEDEKSISDFLTSGGSGAAMAAILKYRESYLSAENGKVLAVAIRPSNSSLSIGESEVFLNKVDRILTEMNPQSYHPQIQIVQAGSVPQAIAEFNTIKEDIVGTAIELIILIMIALFLFIWSVPMITLLTVNLLVSLAVTLGITQLHIGYLNTQTAFLGSLVVGTGINYGVILISRYLELKRKGVSIREALLEAHQETVTPTFIASSTTGVSFATLLLASNQGLSQFGFIGFIGVLFCWIAAYLILPLWLYEWESRFGKNNNYENPLAKIFSRLGHRFGQGITDHAKLIVTIVMILSAIGYFGARNLINDPLELNFDNIRNKLILSSKTEELRQRVYKAFPTSLTPSLAFAKNEQLAEQICPAVRRLKATLPAEKDIIESCASLYDLYPKAPADRAVQLKLMKDIQSLLGQKVLKFTDEYDLIKGVRDSMSFDPPTLNDIPEQILRRFREKDGKLGFYAVINPDSSKPLDNGVNLLHYTDSLSPLKLNEEGDTLQVSGDSFVLADLLRGIKEEGPYLTIVSFLGVAAIGMALTGGISSGLFMTFLLIISTYWMICIQGAMDLKYNFFNFIVLPLTFGIGIDYPINVFMRWKSEGYKNYGHTFTTSGMAVFLCSITTAIGYYTLLGATSQALAGFGKLAIIGEIACVFSAIIFMPAIVKLMGKAKP